MTYELDFEAFIEQLRDMADDLEEKKKKEEVLLQTIKNLKADLAKYEFQPKEAENLRSETAYAKQQLEAARQINGWQQERIDQLELVVASYKKLSEPE